MALISPRDFFDLQNFRHAQLFEGVEAVWEVLPQLAPYLAGGIEWPVLGEVAPSAVIQGPVAIGRGTVVEPGAMIVGPAIIGEECVVRHSAYLRGYVITGDGCVIGHGSEVKSSLLLNEARAPHFNYVGDSILGNDTNLGAGVMLANLRLDERAVMAADPSGERIPSSLHKFGAIIGDGARIACNVVLNPGTLIPPGSHVLPSAGPPVIRSPRR